MKKMQRRREELEQSIARCESEIGIAETELATFKSAEESIRLAKLIEERRVQLQTMMKDWEQLEVSLD